MPIRSFIGFLVLTAMLTACVYPLEQRPDDSTLGLVIEFPETMGTKAGVGEQSATADENIIKNLRIWVFDHDDPNHPLVSALRISNTDFPVGENVRRYALQVSKSFAENPPHVDVFVLANASAVGASLSTGNGGDTDTPSTYEEVSQASFQDEDGAYDGFGTVHQIHAVLSDYGLPMSGCLIDQEVEGSDPQLVVPTVTMSRMVSRIRFVFCKSSSDKEDIRITGITLHNGITIDGTETGNLIAAKEYLFLTNGGPTNLEGYVQEDFVVFEDATGMDVAENAMPERFVYGRQAPDVYEKLIQNALSAGELTALPSRAQQYTYLRESDKKLVGTVYYKVWKKEANEDEGRWSETKSKSFVMADEGDFARNHTWTVYGYFLHGSNLQFSLNALPWEKPDEQRIDFSGGAVVVTSKFQLSNGDDDALIEDSSDPAFDKDVTIYSGHTVKAYLVIEAPKDGTLYINPQGEDIAAFHLESFVGSDPNPTDPFGVIQIDPGKMIRVEISRNPEKIGDDLKSLYFTFDVELSNERKVGGDSEIVDDKFRFRVR